MVPALSGMPHYNSDGYSQPPLRPLVDVGPPQGAELSRAATTSRCGGGYGMPGIGSFAGIVNRAEGYGIGMKQAIRDEYGTSIGLAGRGEMIPNEQSYCEIDPEVSDRWGIPVLRFHWAWSDHELNQVRHMQATFRQILEGMGGRIAAPQVGGRGGRGRRPDHRAGRAARAAGAADRPGRSANRPDQRTGRTARQPGGGRAAGRPEPRLVASRSHAAAPSSTKSAPSAWATTRRRSPLNRFCQAHEVKNLFVADAAPFVSNADKNPTHTIVALAWRTAEYLAEEMRKGNV